MDLFVQIMYSVLIAFVLVLCNSFLKVLVFNVKKWTYFRYNVSSYYELMYSKERGLEFNELDFKIEFMDFTLDSKNLYSNITVERDILENEMIQEISCLITPVKISNNDQRVRIVANILGPKGVYFLNENCFCELTIEDITNELSNALDKLVIKELFKIKLDNKIKDQFTINRCKLFKVFKKQDELILLFNIYILEDLQNVRYVMNLEDKNQFVLKQKDFKKLNKEIKGELKELMDTYIVNEYVDLLNNTIEYIDS